MNWDTILEWIMIRWRGAATAKRLPIKGVASWTPPLGKCEGKHWHVTVIVGNFKFHFVSQECLKGKQQNLFNTCQITQLTPLKLKWLNLLSERDTCHCTFLFPCYRCKRQRCWKQLVNLKKNKNLKTTNPQLHCGCWIRISPSLILPAEYQS